MKNQDIKNNSFENGLVEKKLLNLDYWNFIFKKEKCLYEKLNNTKKLRDLNINILVGLQTSADPVYIVKLISETNNIIQVYSKATDKEYTFEKEIIFPLLRGANVIKYQYPNYTDVLIFPYKIIDNKAILLSELQMREYSNIWNYLLECKELLYKRANLNENLWWAYTYPKNLNSFYKPKIMTTVLSGHNSFTLDFEGKYYFVGGGNAGVYGIQLDNDEYYHFILGLLNSKLLNWFHHKISLRCYQTAYSYGKRFIEQLPVPQSPTPAQHDKMVELVERMLRLNKEKQTADEFTKKQLEQFIARTDKEIDALVYELYGLTPDEIKIVEGV